MPYAIQHTLLFPLEANKGIIMYYDLVDGKMCNVREANAKELVDILNDANAWNKHKSTLATEEERKDQ